MVYWDIKHHFVLHRKHIASLLQSPAGKCYIRFELFTALTMKNVVFWDIKPHFVPLRKHIKFLLQSQAGKCYVRIEVFMAVTMKKSVFWDINAPVLTPQETHVSATEPSR
jgi:hypothetical protein